MATLYRHSARLDDGVPPEKMARAGRAGEPSALPGRSAARRRPRSAPPRHAAYALALATVSVLAVGNSVAGGPLAAATAAPELSESAAVADALGIDSDGTVTSPMEERELLGQLAASRAQRDAEQAAAVSAQAQAEQAAAAARAEAEAKAAAEAEAAAKAAAEAAKTEAATASVASVATSVVASAVAKISNSAGAVRPQVQAAANAVVSNVPGADSITIGGTRSSAVDPNGHPSGRAIDFIVGSNSALGDAIVAYLEANWEALGLDYAMWEQRIRMSGSASWQMSENRGSPTANHMDNVHINLR